MPRWCRLSDALGGSHSVYLQMHLEAEIKRVWRCTQSLRSSVLSVAIGDQDWVSIVLQWGAVAKWDLWWTWRPWVRKYQDALGGYDWASFEIQLVAIIKQAWKCTCRLSISKYGDSPGGQVQVSSEMHLWAAIKKVWRYNWRDSSTTIEHAVGSCNQVRLDVHLEVVNLKVVKSGVMCLGSWDSMHY